MPGQAYGQIMSRKLKVGHSTGLLFFFFSHLYMQTGVMDSWDLRETPAPCPWCQDKWVDVILVLVSPQKLLSQGNPGLSKADWGDLLITALPFGVMWCTSPCNCNFPQLSCLYSPGCCCQGLNQGGDPAPLVHHPSSHVCQAAYAQACTLPRRLISKSAPEDSEP